MKLRSSLFAGTSFAALLVVLSCSTAVGAPPDESAAASEMDPACIDLNSLSEPEALHVAYLVLLPGNHNYSGHRARAMDEISAAAASFGLELKQRGKGGEDQKKSDARIALAWRILDQVRPKLTSEEQQPLLEHIERAMKHLSMCLQIRRAVEEVEANNPL